MDAYFPIKDFEAVYLLDLCEPLLEVARKRFAARGWTNVHCLKEDACTMNWTRSKSVDIVTFSYSLSMIPNVFAVLDHVDRILSPDGIVGVCDFYVSGREAGPNDQAVGRVKRQMNWLTRVFWLHWCASSLALV
jgi:betaine lipid synthase